MKKMFAFEGRIIEESLKLFSVKGYEHLHHRHHEAAGTSKGGFYNHFRSKEQLFHETLSSARKIWRERNLHGLDKCGRSLDRIKVLLENYRDRYLSDAHNFPGGCIFVNLAIELSDQAPELAREVNEGFVRLKRMIRRYFDEERKAGGILAVTDTDEVTNLVFSGLLGACVMYTSDKSRKNLNAAISSLISYIYSLDTQDEHHGSHE
jgi:TetR/AcrR family transcriptional repressor of nem operon